MASVNFSRYVAPTWPWWTNVGSCCLGPPYGQPLRHRAVGQIGEHVEARADAVLHLQRQIVAQVVEQRARLARDVRAAEEVRAVRASVVVAGAAVAVGEAADVPAHAAAIAEEIGQVDGEPGLVDAELGGEILVVGVGEVVAGDLHGGEDARVAVDELELGPGTAEVVGVFPVGVRGVGDARRRVELEAVVDAAGAPAPDPKPTSIGARR
jgi:hypothetical protein